MKDKDIFKAIGNLPADMIERDALPQKGLRGIWVRLGGANRAAVVAAGIAGIIGLNVFAFGTVWRDSGILRMTAEPSIVADSSESLTTTTAPAVTTLSAAAVQTTATTPVQVAEVQTEPAEVQAEETAPAVTAAKVTTEAPVKAESRVTTAATTAKTTAATENAAVIEVQPQEVQSEHPVQTGFVIMDMTYDEYTAYSAEVIKEQFGKESIDDLTYDETVRYWDEIRKNIVNYKLEESPRAMIYLISCHVAEGYMSFEDGEALLKDVILDGKDFPEEIMSQILEERGCPKGIKQLPGSWNFMDDDVLFGFMKAFPYYSQHIMSQLEPKSEFDSLPHFVYYRIED